MCMLRAARYDPRDFRPRVLRLLPTIVKPFITNNLGVVEHSLR